MIGVVESLSMYGSEVSVAWVVLSGQGSVDSVVGLSEYGSEDAPLENSIAIHSSLTF